MKTYYGQILVADVDESGVTTWTALSTTGLQELGIMKDKWGSSSLRSFQLWDTNGYKTKKTIRMNGILM